MKKIIAIFLSLFLLAGCASTSTTSTSAEATAETTTSAEPLKIVATIFPQYDWTREILGDLVDQVDLTLLMANGIDLHSYQATADDIITISDCDLFIYVGGESDSWVDAVLANAVNPDMQVLNLMDVLGDAVKVEEMVEGMQETEHAHDHGDEEAIEEEHDHDHDHEDEAVVEEEHDHDHDHDHEDEAVVEEEHDHDHDHEDEAVVEEEHDHDHDEETENDEHVWLSLRNAQTICSAICDALVALDGDNAATYTANTEAYIQQLSALDASYGEMVESAARDTILVADRFPFRYLVDDYNIQYYAAFVGCSAETEASFETIAFLAGQVDALDLTNVITLENSDNKIADTVIASSVSQNQEILTLNSIQSVTTAQMEAGATYLSMMEENLVALTAALG